MEVFGKILLDILCFCFTICKSVAHPHSFAYRQILSPSDAFNYFVASQSILIGSLHENKYRGTKQLCKAVKKKTTGSLYHRQGGFVQCLLFFQVAVELPWTMQVLQMK